MPHYLTGNSWWSLTTATTLTNPTENFWGNNYVATSSLGIYQNLLIQPTLTTGGWTNVVIGSPTSATTQPAFVYYASVYADMPMPHASQRVRRIGRSPAVIHAGRRAVRRSIDLFLRLRPAEELRTFLDGRALRIQGARFCYELRRSSVGIMEHTISPHGGHAPFHIYILHPSSPHRTLASGCVYLDHTPILDQLLAFIMHVTDPGGERDLIERANWTPPLPRSLYDQLRIPQRDPPLTIEGIRHIGRHLEESLANAA